MVSFYTEKGSITVDFQSENFYLCTTPAPMKGMWEVYVVACYPEDAARRAFRFWYGKDPKLINK